MTIPAELVVSRLKPQLATNGEVFSQRSWLRWPACGLRPGCLQVWIDDNLAGTFEAVLASPSPEERTQIGRQFQFFAGGRLEDDSLSLSRTDDSFRVADVAMDYVDDGGTTNRALASAQIVTWSSNVPPRPCYQ